MPTQEGAIWAQNVGFRIVERTTDIVTINFAQPRTITADTALGLLVPDTTGNFRAEAFWAECGIFETSADSQSFDPPLPRIQRSNITFIRFKAAAVNCRLRYRWSIHFWA